MLDELTLPLAEWELGLLWPERVPDLAVAALERGCELSEVAVLAGMSRPLRDEVADQLARLLRRLGLASPTETEAVNTVVDARARAIVDGAIAPANGAHQLWRLFAERHAHGGVADRLALFSGLASEWDDHPEWRADIEKQIVEAARALIGAGAQYDAGC